jgi:hypothetical protein
VEVAWVYLRKVVPIYTDPSPQRQPFHKIGSIVASPQSRKGKPMTVMLKDENGALEMSGGVKCWTTKVKSTPMPEIRSISVVAVNQTANVNYDDSQTVVGSNTKNGRLKALMNEKRPSVSSECL